ncbi:MAG: carboxylating nicotinate-nucleotide diphosphorylase [Gammaproteobacteria bacterium]|nr:carboxylating nicotinate-nucleotide diphosphorylase [Gammaproteobacteria bacterium]
MELPSQADIQRDVTTALEEDIGTGDLTAALIPNNQHTRATIITREQATLCGTAWVNEVFKQLDANIKINWLEGDGNQINKNQILCQLEGNTSALLTGERTALNFLQTLSGTATLAKKYSNAVAGTRTVILDTRKTIPGLRTAQKYAVRCGGCKNHRTGLYDGVLIKENHIAAAGSVTAAINSAKKYNPDFVIEIEVENLDEFQQALDAGADILLLDNFDLDSLNEAVQKTDGKVKLEASGGINLENIRSIAEIGVDYISIGDLTKNVRAIDLSMRFQ